jgi:hypothetical protein
MDAFMNGVILVEATALSILAALWMTWIGLRGLFNLMPHARLQTIPVRKEALGTAVGSRSHAA